MSSYENVESTDAGIDLWRVQLGTGEIRVMSLDALDDAFQAGTIDESTPVLAPGAAAWSKLGDAAGLEGDAPAPASSNVNSLAPIAVDAYATGPSTRYAVPPADYSLPDLDLDTLEPDAFKAKKGRVYAAIGMAAMVVCGLGFAATRLAPVTSSAANALSAEAARKAAAAAPAQAHEDEQAAARLKALTEEQRIKLLEADKAREAREAAKRKDRPAPPGRRSGPQPKSGTPFVNGGDKFDPLNGAL
jgi:hypothetical protein